MISTSSPAATASSLATAAGLASAGTGAFRSLAGPATVQAKDGRISGRVTAATDHKPLRGICVLTVRTSGNGRFTQTHTSSSGRYQTPRMPAGRYLVAFLPGCGNKGNWTIQIYKSNSKPTAVRVRAGKTTTGINVALSLGGEISGTITSAGGKKLSGICVSPVSTKAVSSGGGLLIAGVGESRGVYHLHSVPAGSYKVLFQGCGLTSPYAPVWWRHAATYQAGATVRVKAGKSVTGINVTMPVGGVISGTVTNAASAPVPGICVSAGPAGNGNSGFFFGGDATTNSTGQYKVEGLPAGSYQVQFQTGCGNNGNYVPATSATIAVQLGGTYTENVTLEPGARVSGTVTSQATGKPLGGICVIMWSDSFNYDGGFVTSRADGSHVGSYVINNQVPPGTYYLAFFGGCGNTGSYGQVAYNSPSPYSLGAGHDSQLRAGGHPERCRAAGRCHHRRDRDQPRQAADRDLRRADRRRPAAGAGRDGERQLPGHQPAARPVPDDFQLRLRD